jgi:hypothetical protein
MIAGMQEIIEAELPSAATVAAGAVLWQSCPFGWLHPDADTKPTARREATQTAGAINSRNYMMFSRTTSDFTVICRGI